MNNDYFDADLEDLQPPLTLRRHNAIRNEDDLNQRFIDTENHEIVYGNPDITNSSNKNLVKLTSHTILWKSGRCNPNQFFISRNDDHHDQDPWMNEMPIIGCTV